jgi:hypothetical protein
MLRALASPKNSVACSLYIARLLRIAPTVILWNIDTFVASQTYYDFTAGSEGIVPFTHKFTFDAREDAAGAVTISTMQT